MTSIQLSISSATPTLQRLNSRGMLRAMPGDETTKAIEHKKNTRRWLAPPLAPKAMAPLRHSKGADAAAMLQRIERIEIADVVKHEDDKKDYYVINVYLKHEQSRIPTNQARFGRVLHSHNGCDNHTSHAKPDYTIHRRFSEFEKLRKDLWESVQYTHRIYCTFCDSFSVLLLFSSAQPGVFTKAVLRKAELRAKILDKFLHNVVGEFQQNRPRCRFACHGMTQLPAVLGAFLFGDEEHNDGMSVRDSLSSESSNPIDSPTNANA